MQRRLERFERYHYSPIEKKNVRWQRQLSSKTTSMVCVWNFRFIYISIWVHFHWLQQLSDTKQLKKNLQEPEMETDGRGRLEQSTSAPSNCSQWWQNVIKNALKNVALYWSTARLWEMSNLERARTARWTKWFFFFWWIIRESTVII